MVTLKSDIQIACPLGIITAAAQADADNSALFAVYVELLVCDTYTESVSAGSFGKVLIGFKILKADLIKEIDQICRAFLVPGRICDIARCKAHRHGNGCKVLPVGITRSGKILIAVGERTRVVRLHVIMSGIKHDTAGDSIILISFR